MKTMISCSHLTAFGLSGNDNESCMDDEHVVALVDALPQLRALDAVHFANLASDAGMPVHHRCIVRWCSIIHYGTRVQPATPLAELFEPSTGRAAGQSITLCSHKHDGECLPTAGLSQMSKFCKLQHLRLNEGCFSGCTSNGLAAALAAMTGIYAAGFSAVWAAHTLHHFGSQRSIQLCATAFGLPVTSGAAAFL